MEYSYENARLPADAARRRPHLRVEVPQYPSDGSSRRRPSDTSVTSEGAKSALSSNGSNTPRVTPKIPKTRKKVQFEVDPIEYRRIVKEMAETSIAVQNIMQSLVDNVGEEHPFWTAFGPAFAEGSRAPKQTLVSL